MLSVNRRTFIKTAAAGVALAGIPKLIPDFITFLIFLNFLKFFTFLTHSETIGKSFGG